MGSSQSRKGDYKREEAPPSSPEAYSMSACEKISLEAEINLQSVHSSFRFSFGSQDESKELTRPPATVMFMVNIEDEDEEKENKKRGDEAEAEAILSRKRWQRLQSLERSISPVAASLVRFTYGEIRSATRGFCRERELSKGPLSRVYRGRIGWRRRAVAIKRVEGQGRESAKAFCRELMITSSLRHRNVVPLLGFCVSSEGLFLVYKFVSRGSLDRYLYHHDNKGKVLPWDVRYKVAVEVARAVEYMHYGTDKCVVHRDIKSSNILLTSSKTPKLCDFGLAAWTDGPFLCKAVKGTFGYLAPEYFQHGKLSERTDIYAFGVVLLELITGRKAIDRSRPPGDENLILWAKPLLKQGGAMWKLMDPRLKPESYCWSELSWMVHAATACLTSEESGRPSIDQVIRMLLGAEETCDDWSVFTGNSCRTGYDSPRGKSDMKSHLALALLGVSDAEEDELYAR